MSRVHRELSHLAHLLSRLCESFSEGDTDPTTLRDGQRIVESIETIARIHNAQEEGVLRARNGAFKVRALGRLLHAKAAE